MLFHIYICPSSCTLVTVQSLTMCDTYFMSGRVIKQCRLEVSSEKEWSLLDDFRLSGETFKGTKTLRELTPLCL